MKNLYISPVGSYGKPYLEKIIKKFGNEDFDYLIFVYDDTEFKEEVFNKVRFIRVPGKLRWEYMNEYATKEIVRDYDYIFCWADDIDVSEFDYKKFIEIMKRNDLNMAQPALRTDVGYPSHEVCRLDPNRKVGRLTDYAEVMVPVLTKDSFLQWRTLFQDWNGWGWGYDVFAKSILGFRIGIIDCMPVIHTKPFKNPEKAKRDYRRFIDIHSKNKMAEKKTLGDLK